MKILLFVIINERNYILTIYNSYNKNIILHVFNQPNFHLRNLYFIITT